MLKDQLTIFYDWTGFFLCVVCSLFEICFAFTDCLPSISQVRNIVKPGCTQEVLKAALSVMSSVTDVLSVMSSTSSNGRTPL